MKRKMRKWMVGTAMAVFMSTTSVCSMLSDTNISWAAEVSAIPAPENVKWSRTDENTATWGKVKDAVAYHVNIYRDEVLVRTVKTESRKADLSEYMKAEGEYYFEVCAKVKDPNHYNKYLYGEYGVSKVIELEDLGDMDGKWRDTYSGIKYRKADYTYPTNEWYKILGKWYYFDENSYMVTGWLQCGPAWYYLNEEGVMQTGWLEENGVQYYLNSDGTMAVGWREIGPGTWSYFHSNGARAFSTVIDGYVINEKGIWVRE